jgi:hypothetical protein
MARNGGKTGIGTGEQGQLLIDDDEPQFFERYNSSCQKNG